MNPSNTQVTPEIKKVIDSNGDGHTVIPTPHSHAQSEVSGLVSALSAKQNTLTFDSTPTAGSTNPVTSGGVKTALDGKMNNKTIDSTPTANSTNLVTSGGVKTALNAKMDNKTIDSTPTANSTNLVTSGGVKTALNAKQDTLLFDNYPTAGSSKPVRSYGIKTRLDEKLFNATIGVKLWRDSNNVLTADADTWANFIDPTIVAEGELRFVQVTINDNYEGQTERATNMVMLARWDYSSTQIFKNVSIWIGSVRYNLRYKVSDETWRELVLEKDIAQYLPIA